MQEPQTTWRGWLRQTIRDPKERQRLAEQIGVNPATLTRWATNKTSPNLREVHDLLSVLPDPSGLLNDLFGEDVLARVTAATAIPVERATDHSEGREAEIASAFYAATLRVGRQSSQRFWSLCNLIFPQMLLQLDPERLGLEITLTRCMPPREDHKVHSLRESASQGTAPFETYLQEKNLFLGSESLAGYAVTHGHWMMVPNIPENTVLPLTLSDYERSTVAFPISLEGAIAGCLIVSSTQSEYFSELRLKLIDAYTDLLRLVFYDEEFYPVSRIALEAMPSLEVQKQAFAAFRKRISHKQREAREAGEMLDVLSAETLVRQEIEQELFHITSP